MILETLYILFKADTSNFKKGEKEVKEGTDKINDYLERSDSSAEKVGEKFLDLAHSFADVTAAAFSAHEIIKQLKETTQFQLDLGRASQALQINIEDLDAWGSAIEKTGGTAEAFQNSLKSLAEQKGVNPSIIFKLLPQIADAFKQLGQTRALFFGKQLGLDEKTILFLLRGNKEIKNAIENQKKLGVTTHQNSEIIKDFNNDLSDTETAYRHLWIPVTNTIAPQLQIILKSLTEVFKFLQNNSGIVTGAILGIATAVSLLTVRFIFLRVVALRFLGVFGLISSALGFGYEQIEKFRLGQDSLIGTMLNHWPIVGKVVNDIIASWNEGLKDFKYLNNTIANGFSKIPELFQKGKNKINSLWEDKTKKDKELLNPNHREPFDDRKVIDYLLQAKNYLFSANNTPLNAQSSSSVVNSNKALTKSNSVHIGEVIINTQATDVDDIVTAFSKGINEQFWQANNNFDDGILS